MVKNPPAVRETWVQSLGFGRSPGEGHGNPLQYSCLENPHGQRARQATVPGVTTFTPLTLFAVTCICRSPVPSIHLKFTNARGGILSRCPAITAKSDGFRGLVPSILVMLVPVNDGGGRQGPDLETDGLGERRAWTSS